MGKVAIITGISGQDGSYLAELLIKKKYKVFGIFNPRKISSSTREWQKTSANVGGIAI